MTADDSPIYYRDSDKKKIDLIIEQDGTLYPVVLSRNRGVPHVDDPANGPLKGDFRDEHQWVDRI